MKRVTISRTGGDPVLLRVYQNLLDSVAEEMGVALERTGFSPNIKERRDYSCALFDARAELIAQAAHIPVHLGSAHLSVTAAMAAHAFRPGDVVLLNDPYQGGTHLPDLTVVSGFFERGRRDPTFYLATRAHHADVGGARRGSMGMFREIYEEGVRIPPVLLRERGRPVRDLEVLLFANMRQPAERSGDLGAQLHALRAGELALARLFAECPRAEMLEYAEHLKNAADRQVQELLRSLPAGAYAAEEFLESDGAGGGEIALRVRVEIDARRGGRRRARFDFTESAPQAQGCLNANEGIVLAAIFYLLRSLAGEQIPSNAGCLRACEVKLREASVLQPRPPAAVAGGNVETSQRLVDLLLAAFARALPDRIPAQSQGTMNNWTIGDPAARGGFSYYETIGGGAGASARGRGASAVHTHMTNTRNTPIEMLERAVPVRVVEYAVRRGSGGRGAQHGGDGIVREVLALEEMDAAILSERRVRAPAGARGGAAGALGRNLLARHAGGVEILPSKWQGRLARGDRLRIESPGGGGYGSEGA